MDEPASGIVKRSRVKLAGPRSLGTPGSFRPEARIVRQDATGATIEVTCACGRKTYLRCDYAAPTGQAAQDGS